MVAPDNGQSPDDTRQSRTLNGPLKWNDPPILAGIGFFTALIFLSITQAIGIAGLAGIAGLLATANKSENGKRSGLE